MNGAKMSRDKYTPDATAKSGTFLCGMRRMSARSQREGVSCDMKFFLPWRLPISENRRRRIFSPVVGGCGGCDARRCQLLFEEFWIEFGFVEQVLK